MRAWIRRYALQVSSLFVVGTLVACSSDATEAIRNHQTTQGSGGSSAGGSVDPGVGGSDTGSGGGVSAGGGPSFTTADAGPMFDGPDGACASTSISGEHVSVTKPVVVQVEVAKPVAIYVMLDQSGSMGMSTSYWPPQPTKWTTAVSALTAFVNDPSSANIDIALKMFPADPGACDGTGYDTPLVPMGPLPGNAQAITNALNIMPNGGGTPIEGGLRGATAFCANFQQAHPDEKCIVLFITDGQPSGCDENYTDLAGIAGSAKSQNDVLTFAFGMDGADFNLLDAIGQQGGTDCSPPSPGAEACNAKDLTSFTAGINALRDKVVETRTEMRTEMVTQAVPCEFQIPTPPDGKDFHADQVNVQYTTSAAGTVPIGQAQSEADCANVASGWYYDDPAVPTKIVLCPDTCTTVQAANDTRVDIVLGCASMPAIPK